MFSSGLLILTQPVTLLRVQIPSLLQRVSQVVSGTLYVHLQPVKGGNSHSHALFSPVPVTAEFRKIIKEIYSAGFRICRKLDIRVLLGNATNVDIQFDQYPLKKGYGVVFLDNSSVAEGSEMDKGVLRDQVRSRFLTTSDVEIQLLSSHTSYHGNGTPALEEDCVLKTYKNCVLGGTFDHIHVGHKILLSEGCMLAEKKLTVGVSEGEMNNAKVLMELMTPLSERKSSVEEFICDVKPTILADVVTIYDAFGPTITDPDFQCIVLSEETRRGGEKVNAKRVEKGLSVMDEVVIDVVADEEHTSNEEDKVSSSSLRKRLLGTLIRPVRSMMDVPKTPYRIGLTGGIASGKSSVCKRLEKLGAGIVDCDKLGHQIYRQGMPAFAAIVEEFGNGVVGPDGQIDRKKLGGIVFSAKSKLARLNQITWPEILKLAEAEVEKFRDSGRKVVVLDAAVLLEAGWDGSVHEVWTTLVPRPEAVKRLMARNGLPEDEAERRLDSQISNKERISQANVALCTLWEYDYTQTQCEKAWSLLHERIEQFSKL